MNIFELMEKHDYNFIDEVIRIKNKIEDNTYKYRTTNYTFFKAVNQCVIEWEYNKLHYTYYEYIEKFHITTDNIIGAFLYLELMLNILINSSNSSDLYKYYAKYTSDAVGIIINLLDKFNKKALTIENDKIIIVENNNIVNEVIKDIKDEDYALALLKYQNVTIENNVVEKEKLLTIISKNILPLIDKYRDNQYKNNKEFYKIADDLSCMLNNFHIRHNNKDGKDEKPFIHTLNNKEKIEYFDTIYNLILLLHQIENYKTIYADKISELKQLL